jgi:PAS domain S-box-containing protein
MKEPTAIQASPAAARQLVLRAPPDDAVDARKYREMVDRAPIGVYQSTPDGRLITANPALAKLLGYDSVPELLSRNLNDIYVNQRERELLVAAFERIGTSAEVELQWRRRDGSAVWLQVNAHTILHEEDGLRRFEGFVRDITQRRAVEQELRQSEERLRLVARATNDAVWDWDLLKDVIWVGEGFQNLFGRRTETNAALASWAERIHDDDRERVLHGRRQVVANGGQFWSDEYQFRRADGTYATVYDHGYVLHDAQAQPVRMVGSMMDITDRKRAEMEQRAQREQLWALSQRLLEVQETERRYLARELHDELGQILTATKLSLQAVQRTRTISSARNMLKDGLALLDQCLRQVRSLSLELRPSLLDDLGLAAALRWYLDRQAERAGFAARFEDGIGDRRLPTEIETTCFRVAQEALTNIARHAGASRVHLALTLGEGRIDLEISDDGTGFEVAQARARAAAGGSLGILGMEERVSLAGGSIRVNSEPGRGTDIRVSLPLDGSQPVRGGA